MPGSAICKVDTRKGSGVTQIVCRPVSQGSPGGNPSPRAGGLIGADMSLSSWWAGEEGEYFIDLLFC